MIRQRLDPRAAARRDADDVLQQAFLKAGDRWPDYAASGMTPYAWLYQIVLDCIFDDHDFQHRRRRNVIWEQAIPDRSSQQMALDLFSHGTSPSKAVAREELQQLLQARLTELLERLKAEDRDILCMRHYDGLKLEEFGQVLGIPGGTARARYARARRRLHELWVERYGPEEFAP
jgi:RNA polymerase sigma-70 factor (ECF subfamily)